MSPTSAFAVGQLKQLIFYHLDNEMPDNANFLAGRLHAIEPRNPDASHLLALSYLRLRRPKAAYDYSQKYGTNGRHLGCAYVFALACQELGRYSEGIAALEKARGLWVTRNNWNKHSETTRRHVPDAAAINNLLAKLWRGHGDARRAGDCYIEAHKGNPFIWDAFQGLCDIGADVEAANTFRSTPEMLNSLPMTTISSAHENIKEEQPLMDAPLALQSNFNHQNVLTPSSDPFDAPGRNGEEGAARGGRGNFQLPKIKGTNIFSNPLKAQPGSNWATPTTNGTQTDDDVEMGGIQADIQASFDEPPAAPARRSKALQRLGLDSSKDAPKMRSATMRGQLKSSDSTEEEGQNHRIPSTHKRTISGHASQTSTTTNGDPSTAVPRRSNRLFSQITGSRTSSRTVAEPPPVLPKTRAAAADGDFKRARATGAKGRASTVGRVVSGNRSKVAPPDFGDPKQTRAPSRSSVTAPSISSTKALTEPFSVPDPAALDNLLSTFRHLGTAYSSLSRYAIPSAIESLQSLPTPHRETPWVLAQLGKAHYEAADYAAAESCFARMLKLQPTRIDDTEVYSTVLWHLKKPAALAFLAHTLRDLAPDSPQTWCAVGNAFSLNREHEQAIACFRRAVQVAPSFGYAWTLLGHEYLANEEFEAAVASFRKGVGAERRGYGGWYGLGKCFERMGKWEEAERHYRIAVGINPGNAVLVVCIGVVLEKLHHPKAALVQYTHALTLAPNSALARFKKARVLMTLRLFADALDELEELKNIAPDEANVFFLLGKCYKGLGDKASSVRAFTTALNLDAKAAQYIKEAMEALDDEDEDDEDDD